MKNKLINNQLEIEVNSFGAELSSIIKDETEYLWQADSKYWGRHSPVLFPIVGKLLDNEYIYNDKIYTLGQHGFARDNEFKLIEQKENYLCFLFKSSDETKKNYPFDFKLFISYELNKNEITVSYKVENKTENKTNPEMYFSIGAHPAFNWPLDKELQKEDYSLEIDLKEAKHYQIFKDGVDYISNPFEKEINLNEELFKNDALIFSHIKNKTIKYYSKKDSKSITMNFENSPYLGIWSKPSGSPFLCIEPWCGVADFKGHNKRLEDKKGNIKLGKDGVFESNYSIYIE